VLRTLEVNTFTFRYATGKGGKFSRDPESIKVARMVFNMRSVLQYLQYLDCPSQSNNELLLSSL